MIYIFDNGKPYSDHALYFIEAPDDFGAWFNEVYRPWVNVVEDGPLMIVAVADKVERRERIPYTLPPPSGQWGDDGNFEPPPLHKFSTMPVAKFLMRDPVIQKRDGEPRPRYRLEVG
jgi:hypothetical protein